MTIAVLFPGQGADIGDAVAAWRDRSSRVESLLAVAARALAVRPETLMRPLELARTTVLQPVLTALTLGIYEELVEELASHSLRADFVAGHSLGELAACAAAGAIAREEVVALAAVRGRLMDREAARLRGRMLAVTASETQLESALDRAGHEGRAHVAAHNSLNEWVVAGDENALRAIAALLPGTPVVTAGPWHSPAMAGAVSEYRDALHPAVTGALESALVCNRTGDIVRDATMIPELLAGQLVHPVRWARSMETLRAAGVSHVIICGPGKSLRRFARAGIPDAAVSVLAQPDDLSRLGALAEAR